MSEPTDLTPEEWEVYLEKVTSLTAMPSRLPHWLRHRWGRWVTVTGSTASQEYQRRECEVCGRSQVKAS